MKFHTPSIFLEKHHLIKWLASVLSQKTCRLVLLRIHESKMKLIIMIGVVNSLLIPVMVKNVAVCAI